MPSNPNKSSRLRTPCSWCLCSNPNEQQGTWTNRNLVFEPYFLPSRNGTIHYDIRFHKKNTDGSGKADAYYTWCHDNLIVGVLFEIESAEKPRLDRAEGLGRGYIGATVNVKDENGNTWNPLEALHGGFMLWRYE